MNNINTKRSKPFKKWFLLVLFSYLFLIIQSTEILTSVENIKPNLIFPFAICCSIFLKKEEAPVIGFICGLFLDCFSNLLFCFSSLLLVAFCTTASIIFKRFVNVHLLNIMIINFILFFIYSLIQIVFLFLKASTDNILKTLIFQFCPVILYTTAVCPLLFLVAKKICFNGKLERIVNKNKYRRNNLKQLEKE